MYHNETTNKQNLPTYIDGIMTCTMTGRWNKRQVTNNSSKEHKITWIGHSFIL